MNRPRPIHSSLAFALAALAAVPSAGLAGAQPDRPAASPRTPVVTAEPERPAASPRTPVVTAERRTPREWVVLLTNRERRERGLVPLRMVKKPRTAAWWQSKYQAQIDRMTHLGPNGNNAGHRLHRLGYDWRLWGENVAAGQPTATDVVRAWMRSDGHRRNMLNRRARHVGVARAYSDAGTPYWTMVITAPG